MSHISEHRQESSKHPNCALCVHPDTVDKSDDLQPILDAWPRLPAAIKTGILAMVKSAG